MRVNCYLCPSLAGYLEPVPGENTVRPVCAHHRGSDARPAEQADLIAAALFGTSVPWTGE